MFWGQQELKSLNAARLFKSAKFDRKAVSDNFEYNKVKSYLFIY